MNPNDPTQQNPQQPPVEVNNPLNVMQGDEQNICEIRRHPIGLISMYISSGIALLVTAVLAFAVAPHYLTNVSSSEVTEIGSLVFVLVAVIIVLFVFIANKVYWGNRWILTTDSLTQVLQRSLFDKQSAQLSLGNLEDVTAQQDGILAHMFNFGVLKVETAGERSKFIFVFCPNPNAYAQQILRARENFEQGRRGGSSDQQRPYRSEGSYQTQMNDQPSMPQQPSEPDSTGGVNTNTQ